MIAPMVTFDHPGTARCGLEVRTPIIRRNDQMTTGPCHLENYPHHVDRAVAVGGVELVVVTGRSDLAAQ